MDLRQPHYAEIQPTLTGKRLEVLKGLQRFGPATGSELAERMGWPATSVLPRLTELYKMGRAQPTGRRRGKRHEFLALARVAQAEMAFA